MRSLTKTGDQTMALTSVSKNGKTKCFIHEMRLPVDLAYDRFQHHICWICQSRLQSLADIDFQFAISEQIVTISLSSENQKENV